MSHPVYHASGEAQLRQPAEQRLRLKQGQPSYKHAACLHCQLPAQRTAWTIASACFSTSVIFRSPWNSSIHHSCDSVLEKPGGREGMQRAMPHLHIFQECRRPSRQSACAVRAKGLMQAGSRELFQPSREELLALGMKAALPLPAHSSAVTPC